MKRTLSTLFALILALSIICSCALAAEEYTLPIAPDGATLSLSITENLYSAASYADNLPVYQELEKRTGVSIDWDIVDGYDEVMSIRLASSEKLSDIIMLPGYNSGDVMKYGKSGKIIPLEGLLEQYAPNIWRFITEEMPDLKNEMTTADGHIWFIPQNFYGLNYYAPYALVIRQDWLEKLDLEVPETLEDWENVMRAFKEKDPNGNGEADEIAFTTVDAGFYQWNNAYGYFGSAFGLTAPVTGERYWPDENGTLIDQYQTEGFKQLIAWLHGLYEEGLMDPALSRSSSELQALHLEDRIGVTAFYADDVASWQSVCEANGHDYVKFLMVESPAATEGGKVTHVMRELTGHRYAITSDCADPILAIKWIDYCYANPEGLDLMMFGQEGVHWTRNEDGTRVWTDYVSSNPEGLSVFNVLRKDGANPTQFTNRTVEFGKMCVPDYIAKQVEPIQANLVNPVATLPATAEEKEELTVYETDLSTYTKETLISFVQGNKSLDEWDSYIQTMKGIGADRVLEIKQTQYDRMMGK